MTTNQTQPAVMIIAEAGVNHNGNLDMARQLIAAAADAGADYVKFQTFKAKNVVTAGAQKAGYQKRTTGVSESQQDMIRKFELDRGAHEQLINYCRECGIGFLSTPFDHESIEMLDSFGMDLFKVPSGEITNLPYLRAVAACSKPMILSTGMATLSDVENALEALLKSGCSRSKLTILHCNTEYPTPMHDVNLRAMLTLRDAFKVAVGYSDHTLGTEVPIAAVAMGATVIEKHLTLDRELPGPDHAASLEPTEMAAMVTAIRNIEQALGHGIKRPSESETPNREIARRSVVAAMAIKAGETLTATNLTAKRPGGGISPMEWDRLLNRPATRDYAADEMIEW